MTRTVQFTAQARPLIDVSETPSAFWLRYFGSSVIRYWPLDDALGATTAHDISGNAASGTVTAVTFGQTGANGVQTSALFSGATDRIDIYSAAWNTIFDRTKGTAMFRFKMANAGIWTDGELRVGLEIRTDGNNALHLAKNTPNNDLQCAYHANATFRTCDFTCSDLLWHHLAITWSQAANEWRAYLDGVLGAGLPQTIGTWSAGALDASTNNIGQYGANILRWQGWLQDVIVLNRPATAAEILMASTVR